MVDQVELEASYKYEGEIFGHLLIKMPFLRRQIIMYLDIATSAIVGKYADKYGFSLDNKSNAFGLSTVEVGPNYSIASLAKSADMTDEKLTQSITHSI